MTTIHVEVKLSLPDGTYTHVQRELDIPTPVAATVAADAVKDWFGNQSEEMASWILDKWIREEIVRGQKG